MGICDEICKQGVPTPIHCLTMMKSPLQATNHMKPGMIPKAHDPAILALVTSGMNVLFFTSSKSSNEDHLPLTRLCPTVNRTQTGRRKIPKPSCCDGPLGHCSFKMLMVLAKNGKVPNQLAKVQPPKLAGCLLGTLT